jgi:hypothetical protein
MGPTNDQETGLAKAIRALDKRELDAYQYTLKKKQPDISPDKAEEFFQLYLHGQTCQDIQRGYGGFSYGQIVACKVKYEWDARREQHRAHLVTEVPAHAQQVHLETVDFLADMLSVTQQKIRDGIRKYQVSKNPDDLKDLPLPKSMKDLQALTELLMKMTGQDKKRVEFSGKVTVDKGNGLASPVTPEEAAEISARLLAEGSV